MQTYPITRAINQQKWLNQSLEINKETIGVMELADKNVKSSTTEMFHRLTEENMNMMTSKMEDRNQDWNGTS